MNRTSCISTKSAGGPKGASTSISFRSVLGWWHVATTSTFSHVWGSVRHVVRSFTYSLHLLFVFLRIYRVVCFDRSASFSSFPRVFPSLWSTFGALLRFQPCFSTLSLRLASRPAPSSAAPVPSPLPTSWLRPRARTQRRRDALPRQSVCRRDTREPKPTSKKPPPL